MSNRVYDVLKWVAQILLPALGTLYFALAGVWGLPNAEEVVGTIVAVDTFLGALLKVSANAYAKSDARFDGAVLVDEDDEGEKSYSLKVSPVDLHEFHAKDEVVFKVQNRRHARTF